MSSIANTELPTATVQSSKNKKSKKKRKEKSKQNGDTPKVNGTANEQEDENADVADEDEVQTPSIPSTPIQPNHIQAPPLEAPQTVADVQTPAINGDVEAAGRQEAVQIREPQPRRDSLHNRESHSVIETLERNGVKLDAGDTASSNSDDLQREVSDLREALERFKQKHEEETNELREELSTTNQQKDKAESQYQTLLGKVNTMRTQLGERLKADAEDLAQARTRIGELEEQNRSLQGQQESHSSELAALGENIEQQSKELSSLRNRNNLSQQNWTKERDDLVQRESFAKEEFEAAKQAMQDWEILAMEERSIRESLSDKVAELEEQLSSQKEAFQNILDERDTQSNTVDGLQRALQEIQDARRRELREVVENSQTQVQGLEERLKSAEERSTASASTLDSTKAELERVLPFEKDVKEKNLLIGKLRHEAVILNDHLTKALRYLRKGKPEDTIDKLLVTNHLMHFLALERGDPKKFQILQIIAGLLAWTDEQREQAGLARPGASNPNSKIPVSPWHRTPSTPVLSTDFFPEGGSKKESLADLWSGFLEQQAHDETPSVKSPPSSSSGSKPP